MKTLQLLALSAGAGLLFAGATAEAKYAKRPLSHNTTNDWSPKIGDGGHVVWIGFDGTDFELFLNAGKSTVQLTDNDYADRLHQINAHGQVAWVGQTYFGVGNMDVFFYDGTQIIRLTDNTLDDISPVLSDSGEVAWYGWDGTDYEIFHYDGSTITQLTDNDTNDTRPRISPDGVIVWQFDDGSDNEIMKSDGSGIVQLTDNDVDDVEPEVAAGGLVTWSTFDGTDWEVMLDTGAGAVQLTDNDYYDIDPQVNAAGQVAWTGYPDADGTLDSEIFLFDGLSTLQLTDNGRVGAGGVYKDDHPQINDNGSVVWIGNDDVSNYEIYLYDGTAILNLSSTPTDEGFPDLNNLGQVVWHGYRTQSDDAEVYLATPHP